MSSIYNYDNDPTRHSDDMQDIITIPPPWLLRWGIGVFFGILVVIVCLSTFIRYPDIVKAQLKIDLPNPPLPILAKMPGKIATILVAQNATVKAGQPLAWLVSADGRDKYVLVAPRAGKISFAGVRENQVADINQPLFYIIPDNEAFYGEMVIPQENMGKIKEGQQVLIKLKAYPFEEYGMIKGKITYITEVPYKGTLFMAKVDFDLKKSAGFDSSIHLKMGMTADAEIITQDATILKRLGKSFRIFDN